MIAPSVDTLTAASGLFAVGKNINPARKTDEMGKRKDAATEEDNVTESPSSAHKKHKKQKHKKHKKKKDLECGELVSELSSPSGPDSQPSIKLKIKIGGQTLGTKSVAKETVQKESTVPKETVVQASPRADPPSIEVTGAEGQTEAPKIDPSKLDPTKRDLSLPWEGEEEPSFPTKKPGDETSDEEREWLEALEAGKLDEYEGLKKEKDPSLLTARQRALLHGSKEQNLLELPTGYKSAELTEEQLQRRKQRASKRKQQAHEKREKDKKQTLDRLLKKQEARARGGKGRGLKALQAPGYRYLNTVDMISISIPQGFPLPFPAQQAVKPKARERCGVKGCRNLKKYSCSKTGVPLCSLECYKKNAALNRHFNPPVTVHR